MMIPKLKVPTLIVAGANDTIIIGLSDDIKPIADGQQIIFSMIEDADHFFLDLFAEDVADQIETFMPPRK